MVRRLKDVFWAILLVNILWALAASLINRDILPGPVTVYAALPKMFKTGFSLDLYASLYRLFWGLLSATIVGAIFGILLGRWPAFARIANPVLYFLYPVPKVSLLPILMLFLGLGERSKITLLFLANVFQVIISVRDQVRQIPLEYYQNLQVLNASHWAVLRDVTWPASLSGIFSALRIELAASFALLFILEAYGTQVGLGYYIMDEWDRMEYVQMYAGIVVISILAFILFILLELLDQRFNGWRKDSL